MPSSFSKTHSSTLGFSPHLPVSVYGTDVRSAPHQAFLACRLETTWIGVAPAPRTPLSACAYWVERPSTKPLVLRSTVPQWFVTLRAGPEFSPAFHRLRLWGLDLGSASPCADCHGAGILRLTVRGVFTRVSAFSVRHPHFPSLQPNVSTRPSLLWERSPTPLTKSEGQASVGRLIPTILGAFPLDW